MLSYIHSFHAGNHADILKHLTLTLILESLCKKEKPFAVFDTHAGSGIYNLDDERLLKTGEADSGIKKLMGALSSSGGKERFKELFALGRKYLEIAKKYYDEGKYPGSPLIESEMLRSGDEQTLSELHPAAAEELSLCFRGNDFKAKPHIHRRDGYEMLNALTPPKIKRGLCVIDPSYEDADDYEKCARTISAVHKKWPAGIIALWYPLLARKTAELSGMKEKIFSAAEENETEPKTLDIQLEVKTQDEMTGLASMYGSGMIVINFPYELDKKMEKILPELSEILGESAKNFSIERI